MNAAGIIALAGAHGVRLIASDKRISAKPASAVTAELRDAIRNHSAELLKVLTHDHRSTSVDPNIESARHAPDLGRALSDMPRHARQDDTRTAPSDTDAQGGAAANPEIIDPSGPCPYCGSGQWWQVSGQLWRCRACEPHMPLSATTLTLL